jgi:glutaredoxin
MPWRTDADLKVRLFIKPYCSWCDKAMAWLDERHISYQTLDVISDKKANAEMVRLSGQTLAPVIDVDGKILADFGPEELAAFWEKIALSKKSL